MNTVVIDEHKLLLEAPLNVQLVQGLGHSNMACRLTTYIGNKTVS